MSSISSSLLSRRRFIGAGLFGLVSLHGAGSAYGQILNEEKRNARGIRLRVREARRAFRKDRVRHRRNRDEQKEFQYFASYSKALPKSATGEVDLEVYRLLLKAMRSRNFKLLNSVGIGARRLENPESAFSYTLQGLDAAQLTIPAAPDFDSEELAAEMAEIYWQVLLRDTHFSDYQGNPLALAALSDLLSHSEYKGPGTAQDLNPDLLFRGLLPGDLPGPFVSQFLLKSFYSGSMDIKQAQRTVPAGYDHQTSFEEWLEIQNGLLIDQNSSFDSVRRYIRNGRDLAEYAHNDQIIQAYLNCAVSLLELRSPPYDPGNPFYSQSVSTPFTTFGKVHIIGLLGEVARLAFQAAWYQKWSVHRRIRPEEVGGRIHVMKSGVKDFPLHEVLLQSQAVEEVFNQFGSFLLPQAYPEGCPTHPSYPSGHATIAGALVTILKAFFDEEFPITDPVVGSADGTALEPYTGADANQLTLRGELEKLASNVANGRNFAGIHYRTDARAGFELGEQVALSLLRSQRNLYNESYSFSLTTFDGKKIRISSRGG